MKAKDKKNDGEVAGSIPQPDNEIVFLPSYEKMRFPSGAAFYDAMRSAKNRVPSKDLMNSAKDLVILLVEEA